MSALELLERQQVIPVLRADTTRGALRVARALRSAGAEAVELTMTTPGVLAAVRELVADGMSVGVGTVIEPAQVEAAVDAGACFVVSFGQPPGYVEAAHVCGVPCIAGALTPEEVRRALAAGADAVKIYPASLVSPRYLRDLRLVMPSARLVPSGGISPQARLVRTWLDHGALAVSIGSALASEDGAEEAWRVLTAELGESRGEAGGTGLEPG
jgi:2-dehydro-3-deoxyphosphogluconate aldolase/(4S)-4-hydroxy-2-oxoglutarate aldolase